ncbi:MULTISPECIES: hypothetical protein [Anaerococcus]|uniref:Lipoprotein n=1 Tax=Anaerococcus octavius TaxID=54007 RepID=A0A2I1M8C9_9FIRM|nr:MULTISPECIES: hypothetical protein [Anaerococcus]MDU7412600.1 hypothetical protein [Anaerococcus sp.]PKZ16385.1 hypothetical protein CYJ34_06085 [Anaerococcus octavius]
MRKRFLIMAIFLVISIVFTSCSPNTMTEQTRSKKEEKIEIFDSNNKKIVETEEQEVLDYFSNLTGMSVENINYKNFDDYFKEIPDDAVQSYHFILTSKRKDKKATNIDFYIYENYPYITMEGMPMMPSSLTWELSKEDLNDLEDRVQEWKDVDDR